MLHLCVTTLMVNGPGFGFSWVKCNMVLSDAKYTDIGVPLFFVPRIYYFFFLFIALICFAQDYIHHLTYCYMVYILAQNKLVEGENYMKFCKFITAIMTLEIYFMCEKTH